ncbi:MAG: hypothetical protein COA43_08575 [Robiginitomaculum sp.]|nr:MAG: hypothetical protein COA43_08575 [Robiginitomaculum sp.]
MIDPDADILTGLAHIDPLVKQQAMSNLMQRHLHAIKSLAWYMLGDEMIAEDITQDTFLRAWKQAPTWQSGNAKFSTWLHRVAKNLCYDRLRKRTEIYSDNIPDLADSAQNAQEQLITQEHQNAQRNIVNIAIEKLPPRQKMAITLCHYQNKSQTEAAQIMDVNVRAYESLLARGRQNLRKNLKHHKQDIIGDLS